MDTGRVSSYFFVTVTLARDHHCTRRRWPGEKRALPFWSVRLAGKRPDLIFPVDDLAPFVFGENNRDIGKCQRKLLF